ncbi:hypothetical protein FJY71_02030 [candidate division WOR-3 bacterium]|nr:hypothetical protein [candidate division WOR-3 bacterium]
MIFLRRLHLYAGAVLAPFLLLQAITGFVLRLGKYGPVRLHNWQVVSRHIAYVLAVGLAFMAVSGVVLYLNTRIQQVRRKKKAAARPAQPGS